MYAPRTATTCYDGFISDPSNHGTGVFAGSGSTNMMQAPCVKKWAQLCGGKGMDWSLAKWMHQVQHVQKRQVM